MVFAIGVLAIAVRLILLNQPFIDTWSWRQSDVAAIARNYLQTGFHFAWPQIDWAGTAPGYVGTEFPILPFIAAVCYKLAGVHEWIGRLQSVLLFGLSLPFFAALVRELHGETASDWAVLFYSFAPLSIMTSRCFMPDMPSLSLSIVGLYCFLRWLKTEKWPLFALAALALCLALLFKLPTTVIGAPMACLALEQLGSRALRRPALWVFAAIVLIPSMVWYWHALDIAQRFYPHHFFGEGGVRLMPFSWYAGILRRMLGPGLTIIPCVLMSFGLFVWRTSRSAMFYWWLAAMILFVVVVGYGNRHPWYQLAFVPIAAAFSGSAMAYISSRLRRWPWLGPAAGVLIALVFAVQSYIATQTYFRPAAADLRELGLALKKRTATGAVVVVADYGDPTALYYGERKGWHFLEKDAIYNGHPTTSADAINDLEHLRQEGADYIAFYSGTKWWLDYYSDFARHLVDTSTVVESTPAYVIFRLNR